MKYFFLAGILFCSSFAMAQPKIVKQAVINTTTNVIAPENEDVQNIQGSGGGFSFRNFGDGETKFTTIVGDSMVKTIIKNDMSRSSVIRNNNTKLTTTLLEIMGNKMGFYTTDEEMAAMRVKMDSARQARRNADSSIPMPTRSDAANIEISYVDGSKKVAGYNCKKALVITTRILGNKDTVAVWYTPEIKFEYVASTGGTSSFGGFGSFGNFTSLNGLEKVEGFVMQYEMNMRRGRRMIVEVTKIDLNKEVTPKDFEIPKDFDVKPMKEFQGMMQGGPGGQQFRMMERPGGQ